jgi:chromosome segregation ATPase
VIPMGNWADRIDELESENHDLMEENSRQFDEITDYLYEIDRLKAKLEERDNEIDQLKTDLEYYHDASREDSEQFWLLMGERDQFEENYAEVQARANSWFEVAKTMTRARDFWVDIADKYAEQLDAALNDYDELKTALRVLGGTRD